MSNSYFQFKQFTIHQDRCAMKVTTDASLLGAWVAERVRSQEPGVGRILDIGTGTGLLALICAQKNPKAIIDAIEIDQDAAEQAAENIDASPWEDRIKIINADARNFSFRHQYDIIISNPPFYENELKADDKKKNIAHHNEGLLLHELLEIIKKNLQPGGTFYLLLPYKRNEELQKLIKQHELAIKHIVFIRQSVNHDYFRIILQGKLKTEEVPETTIDEISICDENQLYTENFKGLLKDYYLYL